MRTPAHEPYKVIAVLVPGADNHVAKLVAPGFVDLGSHCFCLSDVGRHPDFWRVFPLAPLRTVGEAFFRFFGKIFSPSNTHRTKIRVLATSQINFFAEIMAQLIDLCLPVRAHLRYLPHIHAAADPRSRPLSAKVSE